MSAVSNEWDGELAQALVVDDDAFSLAFVASYLQELGYQTQRASNGADALTIALGFDPDVAVLDLDLGSGINGLEVAKVLRERYPWVAIVLLTGHRSIALVEPSLPIPSENFVHVVKSDLRDSQLLGAAISNAIAGSPQTTASVGKAQVSRAQAGILKLVAQGWSNDEIAARRGCTSRAVESLLRSLYANLGISRDNVRNQRVTAAMMYRDGTVTVR